MTTSSALRAAAGILGLFSGLSGGWHAYGAQAIGAPIPTMGLLAFVAILKIAVSVQLALKPGRGVDGVFIFLFGAASIADLDRYLWAPLPSLLITPAAFALGLTLYFRDPQRAASTEAQQR